MLFLNKKFITNYKNNIKFKYFYKIFLNANIAHVIYNLYEYKNTLIWISSPLGFIKYFTNFIIKSQLTKLKKNNKKTFFYLGFCLKSKTYINSNKDKLTKFFKNKFKFFCLWLKKKLILLQFGKKWKILIKGFGRRCGKMNSFLFFRLGQSFTLKKQIPKNISFKLSRKRTRIKLFTTNVQKAKDITKEIIDLKPTFKYKDVGIRLFGKKPKLKKRKVTYTY